MMQERGKSDSAVRAVKPANKAERSAAELVEQRAGTTGNADHSGPFVMSGTDVVRVKPHLFQKGHAKMGGRQKGTRNKFGGDLREAVVAGIQAVGFIQKDKKGPKHGQGGVQGFIEWLALNEPKTAAALFARELPYFTNVGIEVPEPAERTAGKDYTTLAAIEKMRVQDREGDVAWS
jgi:hypothetical protein